MPKLKYLDWEPVTKEEKQRAIKLEGEGVWDDHLLPVRPSASSYNQESAGNEKKQSRDNEAKGFYSLFFFYFHNSTTTLFTSKYLSFTSQMIRIFGTNVHIHNSAITSNYSHQNICVLLQKSFVCSCFIE